MLKVGCGSEMNWKIGSGFRSRSVINFKVGSGSNTICFGSATLHFSQTFLSEVWRDSRRRCEAASGWVQIAVHCAQCRVLLPHAPSPTRASPTQKHVCSDKSTIRHPYLFIEAKTKDSRKQILEFCAVFRIRIHVVPFWFGSPRSVSILGKRIPELDPEQSTWRLNRKNNWRDFNNKKIDPVFGKLKGFSWTWEVLHQGLGIECSTLCQKMQRIFFINLCSLELWKNQDPEPYWPLMLDPDADSYWDQ